MFEVLKTRRDELKEEWANGAYSASLEAEMISRNAGATGACSAYKDVLDIEALDLYDGESYVE